MPAPSVSGITPNWGENAAGVPVVIQGANFSGLPTAMLGGDIIVTITAATSDTLTGTVPSGVTPGVYVLTVTNPDLQAATLAPAYTVLRPASPDTTLETGFLTTFGPLAAANQGDDDKVQTIFFQIPDSASSLYFRIYDADTGGIVDDMLGPADTVISYTLRGLAGAYTDPAARLAHPGPAGIASGTLLTQTAIGEDTASVYDGLWGLVFGPYDASAGECIGGSCVFKLVVEGAAGKDGNRYNVAVSTLPNSNVTPSGSRVFAYSWTLYLDSNSSLRPPLYPYVPGGVTSLTQYNFDLDGTSGGMTLHTPLQDIAVPSGGVSGNNTTASSSHGVLSAEDGATWTVTMEFSAPGGGGNDGTFWAVGDGSDLAIFTRPTIGPPP
jgi:hypothetical protein